MERAVLFDFDFTLGDSSAAIVDCVQFAMRQLDLPVPGVEAVRRTIGLPLSTSLSVLTGQDDPALAAAFSKLFVERADEVMVAGTTLYPQSMHVLRTLRKRGIGTAIVSTKFRYRIEAILAAADLRDVVDVIVGGEDVVRHKPHPEALQRAIEALGVDTTRSLYVGDHPVDETAARSAGIRFVRVLTGADHDESAWAPTEPYATIGHIGALLDLPDIGSC